MNMAGNGKNYETGKGLCSGPEEGAGRRLRIAFIGQKGLPASWGGVEHHVDELATRLAHRGHEVTAYVRKWYTQSNQKSYNGIRLVTRPTLYTKHLDASVHSLACSIDTMVRGFDVVHYHGIGPSLFCAIPRMTGKKLVATVHRLDYNGVKWGGFARAVLYWGESCAFAWANEVLVVSQELKKYYEKRGKKVMYLPSGVKVPQKLAKPELITANYGLKGDDYLIYIGRWDHDKRVRELVRAFRSVNQTAMKLVVAGDTDKSDAYRESVIAAAESSPDIIFTGYVTGQMKSELLSNTFGFVTPSEHEGLPIALLEAMAHGRPCLASDIPPHGEAIGAKNAGLLFPPDKSGELEKMLERFLGLSRQEREEMGQNNRQRVIEAYDWERVVDKLEATYYRVLAGTTVE
jgi:glycosyltransferase involved in cell wall biosynthesis